MKTLTLILVALVLWGGPGFRCELEQQNQGQQQREVDELTAKEALLLLKDYHDVLASLDEDDLDAIASAISKKHRKPEGEKTAESGLPTTNNHPEGKNNKVANKEKVSEKKKKVPATKKAHHKSWLHRWVGKLFHGRKTKDYEKTTERHDDNNKVEQEKRKVLLKRKDEDNKLIRNKAKNDAVKNYRTEDETGEEIASEKKREDEESATSKDTDDLRETVKKEAIKESVFQQQQRQHENRDEKKSLLNRLHGSDDLSRLKFLLFGKSKKHDGRNAYEDFPFLDLLGKRENGAHQAESTNQNDSLDVKAIARALIESNKNMKRQI